MCVGGGVMIATHSLHSFTTQHMSCMCKYQATTKSVHFRQSTVGKLNLQCNQYSTVWPLSSENEALNKFSVLDTSTMKSIVQCTWN